MGATKSEPLSDDAAIAYTILPDESVLVKCRACDGTGAVYADGSGICQGCSGSGVHHFPKQDAEKAAPDEVSY